MKKFLLVEANNNIVKPEFIMEGDTKSVYSVGKTIFCDGVNQNNRKYPKEIMKEAIDKYIKEKMGKANFRAMGELNHPIGDEESMAVNPANASHKFVEIWEGDDDWYYTKSKVMDTPNGRIVKTLFSEGITLGISTRGVGEVSEDYEYGCDVVTQYELITPGDYVSDPSAPGAFLDVVKEGKFPIYYENEKIKIMKFKNSVDKNWKVNRNSEENNLMLEKVFNELIKSFN